ncbi:hypothetical protein P7C73_g2338, partial [Tremellales sp. Uapishka_1]
MWSTPVLSSSPLNPNRGERSSSPLSSPTPSFTHPIPFACSSTHHLKRVTMPTRYRRPEQAKRLSFGQKEADLFSEGATPTQSAMWRDKLSRRMEESERRKRAKRQDLEERRSIVYSDTAETEEEVRQAQADDEEKRKALHAQSLSYEVDTGGSDPMLPEFWEGEGDTRKDSHIDFDMEYREEVDEDEDERWMREAAEAERAEENELKRRAQARMSDAQEVMVDQEDDMDWEAMDAMDIE